ncbi:MAG TPA: radical SAM protein, partial [Blastocatellia bacterium]|nr:radical SAM protein [Blastocatellia bacterium]
MKFRDIMRAWGTVLAGHVPSLSIEITRECPLSCPGCYAYNDEHLNNGLTLREVRDSRGTELVEGVLALVRKHKPLHLSIVGGDPLVRLFELEELLPQLTAMGVHCQVVTSAFRKIPAHWTDNPHINVVVSIDGLQPDHDERRKPATYERILRNIAGTRVEVHCTVTRQMVGRPGYLAEFMEFWSNRPEITKIIVSLYTPQRGEVSSERLTHEDRATVVAELLELRGRFPKLAMAELHIRAFLTPPQTPGECLFAKTTETVSADLTTKITTCQFGDDADCEGCGYV